MLNRNNALITGINRILLEALTCETEAQLGHICLTVAGKLTSSQSGYLFVIDDRGTLIDLSSGNSHTEPAANSKRADLINRVLEGAFYINLPNPKPGSDVHAFMGVPLLSSGQPIGLVAVENCERGYGTEDLQALSDLAGAIVQALVHKRTEKELATELTNNKRLQDLSARLIHEGNVEALLSEILMAAIDLMSADMGHIQLYDAATGELQFLAQHGFNPSFFTSLKRARGAARSAHTAALESGRRIVVPDIEHNALFAANPALQIERNAGLRAVQATPLLSRTGMVLGAISTHWRQPHEPGRRELRFLDILARQAADVIERQMNQIALLKSHERLEQRVVERTIELEIRARQLQRLALELSQAEEKEHGRISEILHEDLQQCLSALKYRLWNLLPEDRLDPEIKIKFEDLESLINESIEKTRRLSHELSPPVLKQHGLVAGLKWLATEMQEKFGLTVSLTIRGEANPESSAIASVLFRAVRELLLNIVRHAGTNTALIEVERKGKWIRIVVADRGKGFTPENCVIEKADSGFGLFSLRERISYLGGQVEIQSAPGNGCRVMLTVDTSLSSKLLPGPISPPPAQPHAPAATPIRTESKGKIRILIADDHTIMREGLVNLFKGKQEFEVVAQAANGREAVRLTNEVHPDIIMMDVSMPELDGIEATSQISISHPDIPIIGLSMHDDEGTKGKMLAAGAAGYIYKASPAGKLIEMIRKIHASGTSLPKKHDNTSKGSHPFV